VADQLLVRSYNVGCGDCIYVRIPNGDDDHFHILIDCGTKEGLNSGVLERVVQHLEDNELPDAEEDGKKRLDLVVVTHVHEDHIKGFDPEMFNNIAIGNIWLSAVMDENHEQADGTRALHVFAVDAMRSLEQSGAALSAEFDELSILYAVENEQAAEALVETLPESNGIAPKYVHAGMTSDDLGVQIADTKIHVLAPEKNIDFFYLGDDEQENFFGMKEGMARFGGASLSADQVRPSNISAADFRKLQSRMLSNALRFILDDTNIQNNCSAVLLIEWRGRRLLFVGDAEWTNKFKKGSKNGSWNVMWNERRDLLNAPLDFLKVGHHGSENATPWKRDKDDQDEVNQIFNAILPLPPDGELPTAQCVVSTKRKQYTTIPDGEMLVELGKRVANTRSYLTEFQEANEDFDPEAEIFNYSVIKTYSSPPQEREVGEIDWLDQPQPIRTDMESIAKGEREISETVEFVDVLLDAAQ
jgi:beta-lactamase superfamily II metal-dependent hydrolase